MIFQQNIPHEHCVWENMNFSNYKNEKSQSKSLWKTRNKEREVQRRKSVESFKWSLPASSCFLKKINGFLCSWLNSGQIDFVSKWNISSMKKHLVPFNQLWGKSDYSDTKLRDTTATFPSATISFQYHIILLLRLLLVDIFSTKRNLLCREQKFLLHPLSQIESVWQHEYNTVKWIFNNIRVKSRPLDLRKKLHVPQIGRYFVNEIINWK